MTNKNVIWRPNEDFLQNSNIALLMKKLNFTDYREFLDWSVKDIRSFWEIILEDMEFVWHKKYHTLLDLNNGFPWAKWFLGGETNIVTNCLDRHVLSNRRNQIALIWESDDGNKITFTYEQLSKKVNKLSNAMKKSGLKAGDVAGVFLPLLPEAVITMYACFKNGIAVLPIFSGFGPEGLAERLIHSKAKILFTSDAAVRRGKTIPLKNTVDSALKQETSIEKVILVERAKIEVVLQEGRDITWNEFISSESDIAETENLPANSISMIMYTSGTTGKPKGTVYSHAGLMTGPGRELKYCFDMRNNDTMFWVTDFGWVMAPYELVGSHFNGHSCFLYESVPNHPEPDRLWQIISDTNITHLGLSPTAVRVLIGEGDHWVEKHDLSSLRVLGSTGEPWDSESYLWYFDKVGSKKCPIMNISGGTEIGACLLQPLPVMDLTPCTLGAPTMGTDADVFDDQGNPVRNEVGHLVLKQPIPSLTMGFLNDSERYLETYFSRWDNIWYHGDWAKVDEEGFWYLFGRSDDTIKVSGKRVGPNEIESELQKHPGVIETAVIGTPHSIKGEGITCFVVLANGYEPKDDMREELKDQAVKYLGKSLRPDEVKFVEFLPKTRSAKIVRGAIKKIYLGEDIHHMDLSSLEDPSHLDAIKNAK